MAVVVHENPSAGLELREGTGLCQSFVKEIAICVGEYDELTAIFSRHEAVGGVLVFDSGDSGHASTGMGRECCSNSKF